MRAAQRATSWYYRQYVTECGEWLSYQYSPLDSDAGLYGDGDALHYFLYPNAMLNLLPGRLQRPGPVAGC